MIAIGGRSISKGQSKRLEARRRAGNKQGRSRTEEAKRASKEAEQQLLQLNKQYRQQKTRRKEGKKSMGYITKKRKLRSVSNMEQAGGTANGAGGNVNSSDAADQEDGGGGGNAASDAASAAAARTPTRPARTTRSSNPDSGTRATRRSARRRGRSDASGASGSAASALALTSEVAAATTPVSKRAKVATAATDDEAATSGPPIKEGAAATDDDEDTPPAPVGRRSRTRSVASAATAGTTGNDSAGPTIAGPVVEVIDPESMEAMLHRDKQHHVGGGGGGGGDGGDGGDGTTSSRDRLLSMSFAASTTGGEIGEYERERLLSFAASAAGGTSAAAAAAADGLDNLPSPSGNATGAAAEGGAAGRSSSGAGRSRKLSIDLSLHGSDPHLPPSVAGHAGRSAHGHDPVVETLVGTAVDALLGSRPRSMSQESIGSLGLRSRSNTLDLMAHAGILGSSGTDLLGGGGRRSRSNTLEFLSGVALGEEGGGGGSMSAGIATGSGTTTKLLDKSRNQRGRRKGKARSGSQGSHSSHQSSSKASAGRLLASPQHKPDDVTSALDHLDALGEAKPPAAAAAAAATSRPGAHKNAATPTENKNRKNSDHSHESGHTLDTHHQKLLYDALITGGGGSGVSGGGRERSDTMYEALVGGSSAGGSGGGGGSRTGGTSGAIGGGRQRSDTTESWAALIATTARDRADSWGGMSDISFGAAAGHAEIVAEITANALHPASADIDDEDSAGGMALVLMHRTPPTSSQASLASGSTGPGAHQRKRAQKKTTASTVKSSKPLSVPKKIAVKAKSTAAKRSARRGTSKSSVTSTAKRKELASSAGSTTKTHSLSVHFPKDMPHGAAAAAAKAAAEAATAAGASPAELSAIVAAAMATVSKQLFNIAGDVEKALVSTKKGAKTPPGMKRVNIEYTSKPRTNVKAKDSATPTTIAMKAGEAPKATPAEKPKAKPAVTQQPAVKKPAPPVKKAKSAPSAVTASAEKATSADIGTLGDASGSIPKVEEPKEKEAVSSARNVSKALTEKKRLPPRKRTDSGLADFDVPVMDLPAPLPDPASEIETPVVAAAPSSITPHISVDYDAVAAAVDAATSATIPGDLASVDANCTASTTVDASSSSLTSFSASAKQRSDAVSRHPAQDCTRPLPVANAQPSIPTPVSTKVRAPVAPSKTPQPQPPLKKRTKRPTPEKTPPTNETPPLCGGLPPLPARPKPRLSSSVPSNPFAPTGTLQQNLAAPTPSSTIGARRNVPPTPATATSASTVGALSTHGTPGSTTSTFSNSNTQSNQKWDEMYDCLVEYVEEQNAKHAGSTRGGKPWKWDGNVPTTYKTKDGKALGRWVNNQRSAKTKGSLKPEREERLLSTGLKWSVLSTNAWPDMLRELRRYIADKEARGESWDGNVPTNYRIKADSNDYDEDKNLGRWINRQRSLFQSGKLKKERQEELERIGLRWSVLSTTSWDVMYNALLDYAEERRQESPQSGWDGNVPANYKTNENPPKSLGRWVNRQRSAFAKNKLKKEFVVKLERAGLKWSVHERRDTSVSVRPQNSM